MSQYTPSTDLITSERLSRNSMIYVSLNAKSICTVPLWFNPFTLNDTLLFDWITLNLVAP